MTWPTTKHSTPIVHPEHHPTQTQTKKIKNNSNNNKLGLSWAELGQAQPQLNYQLTTTKPDIILRAGEISHYPINNHQYPISLSPIPNFKT